MKILGCRFEKDVQRAVASGVWDDEVRKHAGSCPVCREVELVSKGLLELNRQDSVATHFPDPRQILWRAEWIASRSAEDRVTRPILLYQRFAAAFCTLGLAALALWFGPQALDLLPAWNPQLPTFGLSFLTPAVYAAAALGLATILLICRALLAED